MDDLDSLFVQLTNVFKKENDTVSAFQAPIKSTYYNSR